MYLSKKAQKGYKAVSNFRLYLSVYEYNLKDCDNDSLLRYHNSLNFMLVKQYRVKIFICILIFFVHKIKKRQEIKSSFFEN